LQCDARVPTLQNLETNNQVLHCLQRFGKMGAEELPNPMTTSQAQQLGRLVRKARTEKGLSLRSLAEALDLAPSTVSRLEAGQIKTPSVSIVQELSRLLDIPLEDLYGLSGYMRHEGLPELPVYLRSKYGLTKAEAAEIDKHFQRLQDRRSGGRRGTKRSS
jgi:transcriptional regulator with XRE-family HTH domain